MIEMRQSFPLQAMNLNVIKLSQLFLNGPERCDLHLIKRKMEDIDQKTTIRMGKLECLNIDYDIRKCHAKAISTFVSSRKYLLRGCKWFRKSTVIFGK